ILTVTAVPLVLRGWAGRIDPRVQPALAARNEEDRRRFGLSWVSAARRSSQPHSEPLCSKERARSRSERLLCTDQPLFSSSLSNEPIAVPGASRSLSS